jgi:hypothetical protein
MIPFWLFAFTGLAVYGWIARKRWIVVTFGSIPGCVLTYYLLGIGIALALGEGRFYSVPFGGFSVGGSDSALFGSIAFWWLAWIAIFLALTRSFRPLSIKN